MLNRTRAKCARCGCGSPACYEMIGIECWKYQFHEFVRNIPSWFRTTCTTCHKTCTRFGRNVGHHEDCIPF